MAGLVCNCAMYVNTWTIDHKKMRGAIWRGGKSGAEANRNAGQYNFDEVYM